MKWPGSTRRKQAMLAALWVGVLTVLPSRGEDLKEKISGSLKQHFQFDPDADREPRLDEIGVVLMKPLVVQETSQPRGVEVAVSSERIKLSPHFSLKEGGKLMDLKAVGMELELKGYKDLIGPNSDHPVPRWTLLRKRF